MPKQTKTQDDAKFDFALNDEVETPPQEISQDGFKTIFRGKCYWFVPKSYRE
jgi:hypothetical protein